MNRIKRVGLKAVTLAALVAAVSIGGTGAAQARTADDDPSLFDWHWGECWTAECQTAHESDLFADDELEYENPVAHWATTGTAATRSMALARAMDRALAECPTGMKLTGTDITYNDRTGMHTATVSFTCTV